MRWVRWRGRAFRRSVRGFFHLQLLLFPLPPPSPNILPSLSLSNLSSRHLCPSELIVCANQNGVTEQYLCTLSISSPVHLLSIRTPSANLWQSLKHNHIYDAAGLVRLVVCMWTSYQTQDTNPIGCIELVASLRKSTLFSAIRVAPNRAKNRHPQRYGKGRCADAALLLVIEFHRMRELAYRTSRFFHEWTAFSWCSISFSRSRSSVETGPVMIATVSTKSQCETAISVLALNACLGFIWNAFQWHCFDDRSLGKPY